MKQGCCVRVIDKAIAGRFIQTSAQVTQPGLIETVLPAGVFFGTDNAVKTSQLDLNPRRGRTRATDSNTIIKDEHADR